MSDLRRIHCPACGIALTTDYGEFRQPLTSSRREEIFVLRCPNCDTDSTIVLNPEQLQEGGASA